MYAIPNTNCLHSIGCFLLRNETLLIDIQELFCASSLKTSQSLSSSKHATGNVSPEIKIIN